MTKPVFEAKASPADRYAGAGERIAGFNDGAGGGRGGLISLTNHDDRSLRLHVYNIDPGVRVTHTATVDAPNVVTLTALNLSIVDQGDGGVIVCCDAPGCTRVWEAGISVATQGHAMGQAMGHALGSHIPPEARP